MANVVSSRAEVACRMRAVFSHRHSGYEYTVVLLRGRLFGLYEFAAFCLALAM